MAERSQVTITLGRSGQVVKRVFDHSSSVPIPAAAVGTKRGSVRDRLGGGGGGATLHLHNKRLRRDDGTLSLKPNNCVDDLHLSKDDLRFKIMKQTQSNRQQNVVDLRDMLSRSARPSTANPVTSYSMRETRHGNERDNSRRMPELRHERHSMPEPRGDRPRGHESRDDRPRGLVSRDDRQRMAEPVDGRQGMPEPREVRDRVPKLNEVRPRMAERPIGSMAGQYTSLRSSEGPPRMGFLKDSYSPWTLDHIRRKSPDRGRGLSPQRRQAFEDSRSVAYRSRDVSEMSRPVPPTSFSTKQPLSSGPMKSTPLVAPTRPPGGNMQRSQYPVEHLTVERFLRSLGLEKYLISFKVEEVDMSALSQMGDRDLKDLGIPMGPRKKILLALLGRNERQAR